MPKFSRHSSRVQGRSLSNRAYAIIKKTMTIDQSLPFEIRRCRNESTRQFAIPKAPPCGTLVLSLPACHQSYTGTGEDSFYGYEFQRIATKSNHATERSLYGCASQ